MNGLKIRELRKKLSLNQSELAELLEVSKRSVVNYENSEEISPRIVSYMQYILEKKGIVDLDEKGEMIPRAADDIDAHKPSHYVIDENLKTLIRLEAKKELGVVHEKIFALMERILSINDQMDQFKRDVESRLEKKNIS